MVFPLYDDNSDRTITPVVNYVLIAINILVFVFLQQLGTNDRFTYAFSTVPQEIVSGRDVKTPDRVVEHPVTGEELLIPGLQTRTCRITITEMRLFTPVPMTMTPLPAGIIHVLMLNVLVSVNIWGIRGMGLKVLYVRR